MSRCDALCGVRPDGRKSDVSLPDAVQCRKEGVVSYPSGPVCRGHHNAGFVSWSQTLGAASAAVGMAERMRAVVDDG